MLPRVLLLADASAHRIACEIAGALEHHGARVGLHGFDLRVDEHRAADLVVLGASVTAFRSRDGESLRSWLLSNRAAHADQRAAAFDVHLGHVRRPRETAAFRALCSMSARGFRLESRPISFGITDESGAPASGQTARAHAWAQALLERAVPGEAPALVGSGQRH